MHVNNFQEYAMKGETGRGGIKRESEKGSFSRKGDTPATPRQMRAVDIGDGSKTPKVDESKLDGSKLTSRHGEIFHGATEIGGTRRITGSSEYRVPVSTTGQFRRAIDAGERAGRPKTPAWELGKGPIESKVRARSEAGALIKAAGPTATVLRILRRL